MTTFHLRKTTQKLIIRQYRPRSLVIHSVELVTSHLFFLLLHNSSVWHRSHHQRLRHGIARDNRTHIRTNPHCSPTYELISRAALRKSALQRVRQANRFAWGRICKECRHKSLFYRQQLTVHRLHAVVCSDDGRISSDRPCRWAEPSRRALRRMTKSPTAARRTTIWEETTSDWEEFKK